ncbi:neutral ceramidase [Teleopsis dalmanni]|uniref:neutral ceramidase n=1 Tax=Teleopsis dalmanni TaxID=139649 RepID=UPI0018CDB286|nr:neutral ceramidase [Teleopsis dalmanni]XP_037950143.1 neutral ceramidase [Teleopsis dalmanni]XP_037950144.1 neutral ceramidase [Teleopsis dalmanni]XP_037950145.1 neutral ceramidase [Teleopsis dalmanni]XP_037950146.1 neutral ceramidase [Teleopsis dalmanni]XP_037950147.1 neutral ceramidase [Teleopsis dalmanni]XP_037950148.1 neutral ceramidase [Teleopsis dalmanni]
MEKLELLIVSVLATWVLISGVEAYRVGVGRADVTGPPVEIHFMGYANLKQVGRGLHLRQFARSFVVEDDNQRRVVFCTVDAGMMGYAVKREVIKRLQQRYGPIYNDENVVISGTHTHSGVGGFLMHLLYDISILGFVPQTFEALAQGIYLSIKRANDNLTPGKIFLSKTSVLNVNINRSPTSYLRNPEEERAQYEHDVDKTLTQLRFVDLENNLLGAFNWYAVHPVSMNNTNKLVSSDNVGYAELLLEKEYNTNKVPGKGKFVGAFCSSNLGDVSPNIMGPKCSISGNDCDLLSSKCPAKEGECFASGPGHDMFESTKIIGTRLAEAALRLLNENSEESNYREITGEVAYIHQFVDMPNYNGSSYNPLSRKLDIIRGCHPAMGYSFAAGTTDGPGAFNFEQGTITDNAMWNAVRDFIVPPTQEDISCHAPKPILLATGRATFPYEWQPKIIPTQILKIGDLIIAAVPGEFTTMAGRRLRNKLAAVAVAAGGRDTEVILAGLSNIYTSYVTTPEEYQAQRYEAASTIFGPNTHSIYMDVYEGLTKAMIRGEKVNPGPSPPYMNDRMLSMNTGVIFDGHPIGKDFGYVKLQPNNEYKINDTVKVTFIAGNPRNNIFHEKTYFVIERKINEERWKVAYTDASWETKFIWERTHLILGFSDVHIHWTINTNTLPGEYRVRHFGNYKYILGGIFPYEGISQSFIVKED